MHGFPAGKVSVDEEWAGWIGTMKRMKDNGVSETASLIAVLGQG
jgi:hypothetical protein